MRAATHLHTRHSWDGAIRPNKLVDWLVAADIELAVVSDHDTFAGSIECKEIITQRGLPIRIPFAAEVRTERGDVIVVFDDETESLPAIASLKSWDGLIAAVREIGGIIWLPHPYQSHEYVEEMAAEADVVEIFNARCSEEQNRNANLLCARHGAVPAYGADVHRISELGNVIVEYGDCESSTSSLLTEPRPLSLTRSQMSDIMAAEVTNGVARRRPALVAWFAVRWLIHRRRELFEVRSV